ncbi:hypothetical protein BZG36_02605 [Bifiguratus adelaidae]|uniref:Non-structural maintenance of chromosomes element 4 n=1 Tax=Bifiguratus adelaidae TaxID=1938954 RepID=A0A261Y2N8_9FUNG|nr:hypothetical protein BZG36_02605 [Bifiguratus adelaidae]
MQAYREDERGKLVQAERDLQAQQDKEQDLKWLRRDTRKRYRDLLTTTSERRQDIIKASDESMLETLQQADLLYRKVERPQEATLDSQILILSTDLAMQRARNLKMDIDGFDIEDYMARLSRYMGETDTDATRPISWDKLGKLGLQHTCRLPSSDFMLGPLSVTQKTRKAADHARLEKHASDRREAVQLREEDIRKQENETTTNVNKVYRILEEVGPINMFEFFVNPESFSQTIENMFYLSFIVREGKASIDDESGQPMVEAVETPTAEQHQQGLTKKQLMMELDMATWREIIKIYNIQKSTIPTRPNTSATALADDQWHG